MPSDKTLPSTLTLEEADDRDLLLQLLEERFGIPVSTFDAFLLVQTHRKTLSLLPRDHQLPARPAPTAMGLPFLRVHRQVPKLTTGAAFQFGRLATRNVIAVEADQTQTFLTRQPLLLTETQAASCTSRGYVLLRYQDLILCVGFYDEADRPQVKSYFPKAWARDEVQV